MKIPEPTAASEGWRPGPSKPPVAWAPWRGGQHAGHGCSDFLEKVDRRADCLPLISRTEVCISLAPPALFLHRLILIPSHRVPLVIAGDRPRCQTLARASACPLGIKLNDLPSRTTGPPPERGSAEQKAHSAIRANSPMRTPVLRASI